jgi:hypothetical protein
MNLRLSYQGLRAASVLRQPGPVEAGAKQSSPTPEHHQGTAYQNCYDPKSRIKINIVLFVGSRLNRTKVEDLFFCRKAEAADCQYRNPNDDEQDTNPG